MLRLICKIVESFKQSEGWRERERERDDQLVLKRDETSKTNITYFGVSGCLDSVTTEPVLALNVIASNLQR